MEEKYVILIGNVQIYYYFFQGNVQFYFIFGDIYWDVQWSCRLKTELYNNSYIKFVYLGTKSNHIFLRVRRFWPDETATPTSCCLRLSQVSSERETEREKNKHKPKRRFWRVSDFSFWFYLSLSVKPWCLQISRFQLLLLLLQVCEQFS